MGITEDYLHLCTRGGYFDFSLEGKILISGKDRISFLNGLVSNDVASLSFGKGTYAAFLDQFGRIQADCSIFNFENHLLIILPFSRKKAIVEQLQERAKFADVQIDDITSQYALINVEGNNLTPFLAELFGKEVTVLSLEGSMESILGVDVAILGIRRSLLKNVDILIPAAAYPQILPLFLKVATKHDLRKCNYEVYDILRLEAGITLFGIDMDATTVLPETGMGAISTTKGCYLGQEVIARILQRGGGMTAKKLVQLEIEGEEIFQPRTPLLSEGKEVGYITSNAFSPRLQKVIALGFLVRGFYDTVTEVEIGTTGRKGKIVSR